MFDTCPKCGIGTMHGPSYQQTDYGERLRYWCSRCGYVKYERTNDCGKCDRAADIARRFNAFDISAAPGKPVGKETP